MQENNSGADQIVHFVIKAPNFAQVFTSMVQIFSDIGPAPGIIDCPWATSNLTSVSTILDFKMAAAANLKLAIFLDLVQLQT